jgi:hypothetical protein
LGFFYRYFRNTPKTNRQITPFVHACIQKRKRKMHVYLLKDLFSVAGSFQNDSVVLRWIDVAFAIALKMPITFCWPNLQNKLAHT